jgi:hypothetical protein
MPFFHDVKDICNSVALYKRSDTFFKLQASLKKELKSKPKTNEFIAKA